MSRVGQISVPSPTSVAFDKEFLYVPSTDESNPCIYKINLRNPFDRQMIGQGVIKDPADCIIDGDTLYVAEFSKAGQVIKLSIHGAFLGVFATLEYANGIRLGPDGNIYVTQTYVPSGKGSVNVFSKDGEKLRSFPAQGAYGLAFNPMPTPSPLAAVRGNLLYVADWTVKSDGIIVYTPEGQRLDSWGGSYANMVFGLSTDGDGNTYICTFGGDVTKYNSGRIECGTAHTGNMHLSDVEVGPDGLVYVADRVKNAVLIYKF